MNVNKVITGCFITTGLPILISFYIGCRSQTAVEPEPPYKVPAGQYIFVEHHVHVDGVTIEGDYYGPMIDFPTYIFDSSNGILQGMINFTKADSLIGVYGDGESLSGAAGKGAGTVVSGIYSLPHQNNKFNLTRIDKGGIVTIKYNDSTHVLATRKEWISITSKLDTTQRGIARLIATDRIVNYGLQLKSKIQKW